MSSPTTTPDSVATPAQQAAAPTPSLADLRAEIDRLDDALHDLLMRRAAVVTRVGAVGGKGRVPFRAGREAAIVRRLLGRHQGSLPRRALVRVWRELLAATTAMQGDYAVTVCEAEPGTGFAACAREHFGALTPLRVHRSPAQAIGEVSAGRATAAVLPMPAEDETQAAAWWMALLHRDEPRIHVVARLPFWANRPEGAPRAQALVVAAIPPDASGSDRSLIGLELPAAMSRARLSTVMAQAGFVLGDTLLRRDAGAQATYALMHVTGLIADDDPRLSKIPETLRPPVVLGAYAVPLDGESE